MGVGFGLRFAERRFGSLDHLGNVKLALLDAFDCLAWLCSHVRRRVRSRHRLVVHPLPRGSVRCFTPNLRPFGCSSLAVL